VILDDCDPDFKGNKPHGDGVRALSAGGKVVWELKGLNNCEASGAHHGVALDRKRDRIYVLEYAANRVTALDKAGKVIYRVEDLDAYALAVDEETGNLWCTSHGEGTFVLDRHGKQLEKYDIHGLDIDYDPNGECFWLVTADDLHRIDRAGKPLFQNGPKGFFVSVASAPAGNGAWVVSRSHRDLKGSLDMVLFVSTEGNIIKQVSLPGWAPFGVACETKSSTAWVVDLQRHLFRISLDDNGVLELPIPALAGAVSPTTDHIWVTTATDVLRLDGEGKTKVKSPLGAKSDQSWLAAY
jgi:hypothetical protein